MQGIFSTIPRHPPSQPIGGLPKLMIAESRNFPELAQFYYDEVILRAISESPGNLASVLATGFVQGDIATIVDASDVVTGHALTDHLQAMLDVLDTAADNPLIPERVRARRWPAHRPFAAEPGCSRPIVRLRRQQGSPRAGKGQRPRTDVD